MTLRELSKYYKLNEQLERNREMLKSLYASAGLGAQEITGMPRAPGVSDRVSAMVVEIEDLKKRIARLETNCLREKRRLERYIGTIEDDQTRVIFRLRFVHCMTWSQVAEAVNGGNTKESVKMRCYRYLDTQK